MGRREILSKRSSKKGSTKSNKSISNLIRDISDYPKPGILFKDITPLLANAKSFRKMNKQMAKSFEHLDFDYVAGIEARGFVIAAGLASLTKTGFIPIRKKGKLPGATISQNYDLEYGTDTLEIHTGLIAPGSKILIVDDVLATGGTAIASINLINQAKLTVVGIGFLLEIAGLTGRKKIQETFPKLEVKVLI